MEKLNSNHSHFLDPSTSITTIIISDWVENRIKELSKGSNKKSLERLQKADLNKVLMEPPVIMENGSMKVCILSRKSGTMWIDQIVPKLEWNRFINYIDSNGDFGKLETQTPNILTKDDLLTIAQNFTCDEPNGIVYLTNLENSSEKALVFKAQDMVITPEIFLSTFLKNYRFENITVEISSIGEDDYPNIEGSLEQMAIGKITISETMLKEGSVTYKIYSLPTIKGLLNNNDETTYSAKTSYNGFVTY